MRKTKFKIFFMQFTMLSFQAQMILAQFLHIVLKFCKIFMKKNTIEINTVKINNLFHFMKFNKRNSLN